MCFVHLVCGSWNSAATDTWIDMMCRSEKNWWPCAMSQ